MEKPNGFVSVGGNIAMLLAFFVSAFLCTVGVISYDRGAWVLYPVGVGLTVCLYWKSKKSTTSKTVKELIERTVKGMVAGLLFIGLFVALGWLLGRQTPAPPKSDYSSMAHIQCKEFVKDRLKVPSSAEFAFLNFRSQKLPDNEYVIQASVEANNSFGVMLKNDYVCDVKWNGSDANAIANWNLISLNIK